MSYEQLAASVDALAEANRSLTEQSLEIQVATLPAVEAAKRFCGVSATAPTVRLDGTPLQQADGSISGSFFSPNAGTIATSVTAKLVVTFVPKDVS